MKPERSYLVPLDTAAYVEARIRLGLPPWGMRCTGTPGRVLGADAVQATLRPCRVLLTPTGRAAYNARN